MPKVATSIQDKEPSSSQKLLFEDSQDDADDQRKRRNMLIMIISCSFSMFGYGMYGASYSQWIYVRFEMDALGENFSDIDDETVSKDPCFRGNHTDSPFKPLLMEAQSNSAHFTMLTTVVSLVPSFFVNLLLGAYSDQLGRRLIFIAALSGNVARTAIVTIIALWELNVNYVLIGYTVFGLTGDYVALAMAIFVYTADNTTKGKNRSFLMVAAQAMNFIFVNMSQFASGYFIESTGYVWPMVTGLIGMSLSLLLVVILLPETLDKSKVKRVSLYEGVKGIFSFYFEKPENPFFKRKDFILMGLVFMVYDGSLGYGITIIFLMNEPFCWSAKHIGYVRSIFGLLQAVLSTLTMKFFQLCLSDELVVVVSLISSVANRFVLAFATTDWHIYLAYSLRAFEPSVLAIVRAILSRMVPKQKRGSLFASLAVIETATLAASGAGLNQLYSSTVEQWRGLMYFVVGCLVLVSAALTIAYKIVISRRKPLETTTIVEAAENGSASKSSDFVIVDDSLDDVYAVINASFNDSQDITLM
ncbi:hypothetical protein RRG08_034831 [Elysia crispata]|uniref:Major facilitator superfamily (MFS) profile domain-containing protein n=1 Tax=Elysia crispata TaxID=231223 RepID=A0AAE1AM95_9GAST|nr:hypothetical protein RRG08_034831 [Elysia crispata]